MYNDLTDVANNYLVTASSMMQLIKENNRTVIDY